jgi:outer membrane protein assembly factor BamE
MMRPVIRQLAGILVAAVAAGCVYRMDIQQGNLLDPEQVDQVEVGMTRSQVRFLLGTPMVIDAFEPDRWDYVYSLRRGHSRKVAKRHLVVWFEGDKVARIEEPIPIPRPASPAPPAPASATTPASASKPADAPSPAQPSSAAG